MEKNQIKPIEVIQKVADAPQIIKTSAQLVTQNAYMMFSNKVGPFQEVAQMHMKHCYNSKFSDVVTAFVRKYNEPSRVCCTTICHVEQIDENKFQFVRRMENVVSSKPLYERIVIDRSTNQLHGFTFENPQAEQYSEHFVYRLNDQGNVNYDMFLFQDPGIRRVLRFKMHNWGVANLTKIIAASELLK